MHRAKSHPISKSDTVMPEAPKKQEEMGDVGMRTLFYEGRNCRKRRNLRKVHCKILRKEKSIKREGGLLKA